MRAVRHLAGEIGPRPGTTRAFHEAAEWVADEFRRLGWDVQQQSFQVPGGASVAGPTAGIPVRAGRSTNVIATRGDVVPGEPWLVVGAHLDTVPTSPGAEDNASGVGALLAVAEAVTGRRTRLPVVLIAFGAEEPRGPSDDDHHYGSRAYVAELTAAQREALRGAVSMDRVGVGAAMPIGSPLTFGEPLRAELVAAATRLGEPVLVEAGQRSSDHWSFAREGMPGVRLGSTSYGAYHSPDDDIGVVDPEQVVRAARIVVAWLR
jgi:Iap family predicted aminopeptidase